MRHLREKNNEELDPMRLTQSENDAPPPSTDLETHKEEEDNDSKEFAREEFDIVCGHFVTQSPDRLRLGRSKTNSVMDAPLRGLLKHKKSKSCADLTINFSKFH